jgi:hypothetical protein
MRSSIGFVKLGSPGLWPAILTLATSVALGSALTGCFIIQEDRHSSSPPDDTAVDPPPAVEPPAQQEPKQVAIEPDKALQWDAGEGVGMFVEYTSGGHWHVWASCDTNVSFEVCNFEAFVTVASGDKLSNLQADTLENGDIVEELEDGALHLATRTSSEFDGMTFDATPGGVIALEAYLDGDPDPRILYWFGDGVLHEGSPTDPVEFKPSAP